MLAMTLRYDILMYMICKVQPISPAKFDEIFPKLRLRLKYYEQKYG